MTRTAKILLKTISSLSLEKIKRLMFVLIQHPFFSIFSFWATIKTYTLAQQYFPKTHSSNGIGNAFRHALWCCLISAYCSKISSPTKAVAFCKKITDLHEDLFPNTILEKRMDLHNNQVGMILYLKLLEGVHRQFLEPHFFVERLLIKTKNAQIIHLDYPILEFELVYQE